MKPIDLTRREEWLSKADILTEALPFMRRYNDKTVVVKYGGHAMGNDELALQFAADIVLLKQVGMHPIVVHGGGPQIGRMLERLAIKSEFVDGLRVTDKETVEIVEMVLSGAINKGIVAAINAAGGRAIGLSGKDGGLIQARQLRRTKIDPDSNIEKVLDLGFVGEPVKVEGDMLHRLVVQDLIPVVAPIGAGANGETFNINADTAAGAVAAAVDASRFLLLTDVAGVLDKEGRLMPELTVAEAQALIADGTISGGMIPKIETCIDAVRGGAEGAVIIDGRVQHGVLLELFTSHGMGTWIKAE
ncbi:acetylglutamate kinase [Thalassobaculum fulvum]|jgi:acetylglutamate kinase|uniref:Acetylglutamate kinase n=1 Tax=Thalassobaculum fulvum TaxID=1633335 RepID=A0A918XU88_9PROT|nr:acetylglutamate kinase [Thalassobaculum fulvum]GHD56661.1 acetylglutamate kinase [Thalassobaculum fulvum]